MLIESDAGLYRITQYNMDYLMMDNKITQLYGDDIYIRILILSLNNRKRIRIYFQKT